MVMVQVHKVMMTIMAKVSILYEHLQIDMIFKKKQNWIARKNNCMAMNLSFVNR